ncbi:MAG: phosphatidate cytidylyltransferase [Corynebacteriales bacterium]|nr:phosphatidate cytidylyltransferase [Mycobacteriales bacterium]
MDEVSTPPPGWRGRHRLAVPEELTPAPASPPSGRNVPVAIAVGVGMGAVALAPLLLYRPAFAGLIAIAVGIGIWELVGALNSREIRPPLLPLLIGGVGTTVLTWFTGAEALVVGVTVTLVAAMLWRMPDGPIGYGRDISAAALVAVYVPLLAGFVVLLVAPDDGALRVIAFLLTAVCSDTGGFVVGSMFGKHRMSPLVSPKKSWEGFAGSLFFCMLSGVAFFTLGFDASAIAGAVFGLSIAVAATVGDLAESLIKRDLRVKDMGNLLPAHGGFMDRFDSLLAAAPVAYLLLTLFAPPQ